MTFFFNFDNFSKFVPLWGNSSAKTQHFYLLSIFVNFLTPLGPLGARPYRFEQKYCPNRLCDPELIKSIQERQKLAKLETRRCEKSGQESAQNKGSEVKTPKISPFRAVNEGNSAKLYIPSTLNIALLQWHTHLNVCAVK